MCESADGVSTAATRQCAGTDGAAFTGSAAVMVTFGSAIARRSSHELPDNAPSNASVAIIAGASLLAHEVRGVVHAAGPFVRRKLRVRAERTAHVDAVVGHVIRRHRIRRDVALAPPLHYGHVIDLIRPGSVAAMLHAGSHEEPHPVVLLVPHLLQHALVVVDRV